MREELFEEILSLVEEYINELDDETVNAVHNERQRLAKKADDNFLNVMRDRSKSQQEAENACIKGHVATEKLKKNEKLMGQRDERRKKALADFKERLLNRKPQKPAETQKAGSDHDNAVLDQHLRNKLEKTLAVSNECFESLMTLIEGNIISFQQKRKDKVLNKNAEKLSQMLHDGSLNAVRVLPNHELIGDPVAIKKVKDIEAENREVVRKHRQYG